MNWKEYNLDGWKNNSIQKNIKYPNIEIILLKLDYLPNPPLEGRRNLLGIDNDGEIKWIAQLPKMQRGLYGFYDLIEPKDERTFKAWCASVYCEIEVDTGEILLEQFVK